MPRNEIGNEIRTLTRNIKSKIFNLDNNLNIAEESIKKSINELNDIFVDIDIRNNISNVGFESAFENKLIKYKLQKKDDYILNAIVNHALYNYVYKKPTSKKTNKILIEDIINEVAINLYNKNKLYKKNRKMFRLKLLENYFIYGSYKNTDKLSNALRRLSKKSNDAAKQFYEMLSDNDITYNILDNTK